MKLGTKLLALGVAAYGLSGCAAISLAQKASEYQEVYDRVDAQTATDPTTMPTTGTATYKGGAVIAGDFGTDENVGFIGDAELTADFAAATVNGRLDNFGALVMSDKLAAEVDAGTASTRELLFAAKKATGSVTITDTGGIIGNTWGGTTSGTITTGGTDYTIAGGVGGQFKGTGASSIQGEELAGFTVSKGSTVATASTIDVVAEK